MTLRVNLETLFFKQPGYFAPGLAYLPPRVALVTTVIKMLEKHELNCGTNHVKEAINESRDIERRKLKYVLVRNCTVNLRHGGKYICNSQQENVFPLSISVAQFQVS